MSEAETLQIGSVLLELAVARRLVDPAAAKLLYQEAQRLGVDPAALLRERGVLDEAALRELQAEAALAAQPKTIGGYRIESRLGQGGMGTVFRAQQLALRRTVALKVLRADLAADEQAAERFLREAHAAARINHPNVVTVHDAGRDGALLWLAMELVEGGDADRLARAAGGRLPPRRALEIVRDATRGLAAIHRAGLLHRDIKPANIFLTADGAAKLADLGLSRSRGDEDRLTVTGAVLGTPAFMSPEQAVGAEDLDIRSDIHALGASLDALITGRAAFGGGSALLVLQRVLSEPFPDPCALVPGLGPATAAVIRRATAKDRAARPQTPDELLALLDAALRETAATEAAAATVIAANDPVATAPAMPRRRRRPALPLIASAAAVVAAIAGWALLRGSPLSAPSVAPAPTPAADTRPAWASAEGVDGRGRWADLVVDGVTVRLRLLPPGSFRMGHPERDPAYAHWMQAHTVTLTAPAWLAETECTRGLWRAVMGTESAVGDGAADLPVEAVSWEDAHRFCAELERRVPGLGARLPTEAEWEYACRAGVAGIPDLDAVAWFADTCGPERTARPVAGRPANAWGFHDMLGNVWEWCQDTETPYRADPVTDPLVEDGYVRIKRGGAAETERDWVHPAHRTSMAPDARSEGTGFRLAIDRHGRGRR